MRPTAALIALALVAACGSETASEPAGQYAPAAKAWTFVVVNYARDTVWLEQSSSQLESVHLQSLDHPSQHAGWLVDLAPRCVCGDAGCPDDAPPLRRTAVGPGGRLRIRASGEVRRAPRECGPALPVPPGRYAVVVCSTDHRCARAETTLPPRGDIEVTFTDSRQSMVRCEDLSPEDLARARITALSELHGAGVAGASRECPPAQCVQNPARPDGTTVASGCEVQVVPGLGTLWVHVRIEGDVRAVELDRWGAGRASRSYSTAPPPSRTAPGAAAELALWRQHRGVVALKLEPDGEVQSRVVVAEGEYLVALDGGWVITADDEFIEAVPAFEDAPRVSVPWGSDPERTYDSPHALDCREMQCLVGHIARISRIDLGTAGAEWEAFHSSDIHPKPFDFFVHLDSALVAVDDFMTPKWGAVFAHDGTLRYEASLPSGVNESVKAAAGWGADTLWLVASYSHMGGRGNRVLRCGVGEAQFHCEQRRESQVMRFPPEEVDTSPLFTGEALTSLAGLVALSEDEVLTCAAERGVLRLALEGEVVVLAGTQTCVDIARHGDRIYVLLEGGRTLSVLNEGLQEQHRYPLSSDITGPSPAQNRLVVPTH